MCGANRIGHRRGEIDIAVDDLIVRPAVDPRDVDNGVSSGKFDRQLAEVVATDGDDLVIVERVEATAEMPTEESVGSSDDYLRAGAAISARISGNSIRSAFTWSMPRRSVLCEL